MKSVILGTMVLLNNILNPAHKLYSKQSKAKRKGMALVKLGGGVADMRGSVGGTVFSRNRYGAIARNRTIPVNPGSAAQTKIRSVMSSVREAWQEVLTPAQRLAWSTYANGVPMQNRLGESVKLTGQNHFYRSASACLYNDLAYAADGPTVLALPSQDESLTVTASAATGELSISFDTDNPWVDEDDAYLLVYASRGQNPTVNSFQGPYLLAGKLAGDNAAPLTSPQTIANPFTLIEGQKTFIQCRILRADGRLSEPFRSVCTCAA
jgi:hypothetical protein